MANNERIDKVIDAIRRTKKFEWGSFKHCVIGIAWRRVLKRKYDVRISFLNSETSEKYVEPVSKYLGITAKQGYNLYHGYSGNYTNREKAIQQLEALKS